MIGEVDAGKEITLKATPDYWTLLYVVHGKITVNNETVEQHNLVVFNKAGEDIVVSGIENAQLLFLSAEPIDEPVAAKDNFVMNTPEEIDQAISDYKNGLFGSLSY
jgi:redox-sensitive bicupin YhaK (pirin superfamily)